MAEPNAREREIAEGIDNGLIDIEKRGLAMEVHTEANRTFLADCLAKYRDELAAQPSRPENGADQSAYEPPTVPVGSTCGEYALAPGVLGYAVEHQGAVYIPVIHAASEGAGDVGKFLDSLSARCRIPGVINRRLMRMLIRRGLVPSLEDDEDTGAAVEVWVRSPAQIVRKVGANG